MIFDLLHNLAKSEQTTIIVVTHDLQIAGKTDKQFSLKDGKLEKGRKSSMADKEYVSGEEYQAMSQKRPQNKAMRYRSRYKR